MLNLQDLFIDNLGYFRDGEKSDVILIGVYQAEADAHAAIKYVINQNHHGPELVVAPQWHILLGNTTENRLFVVPLSEYYVGYLGFFQFKVDSGNVALSIFNNKEAAEEAIDIIRYSVKDEKGNIL